ncbi:tetraspanin-8-like isoform 1-T2 [Clarias gariepinus]|uniref:tetraspanin-8-like n=1 Tax=Clarias gariepinus TaxID=13013 RepID=UPI00234C2BD1|nr:tetraspanin-8-like [Clarias gariepinus]XP_053364234.1 tetraspanin-8-like [Clarias gariepinus]
MAKISSCFKWTFVFFNSLFAIFGIVIIVLGLLGQPYAEEPNARTGVIVFYVIGSIIFCIAVLGAYGAHKESKCALIVFFILMCLATAGMLRFAIPLASARPEIYSILRDHFKTESNLTEDQERALNPIQEHFHCCGLFNGYRDWRGKVPDSCNCVNPNADDTCEMMSSRSVWSKPCGILITEYVMVITMAVLFSLAALAILGGLMSLAMIIRVCACPETQLPSFPLSYKPPKYTEVINY